MSDLIPGNTFSNGQLVTADDLNKLVTNAVIKDGAIVAGHITTSDITQSIFNFPVLNPEDIGNNDYLLLWSVNENGFKRVKKEDIAGMVVADDGTQIINPETGAVEGNVNIGVPMTSIIEEGESRTRIDKDTGILVNDGANGAQVILREGGMQLSGGGNIQFNDGNWKLFTETASSFGIGRSPSSQSTSDVLAVSANNLFLTPSSFDNDYNGPQTTIALRTWVKGTGTMRNWAIMAWPPDTDTDEVSLGIECTAFGNATSRRVYIGRPDAVTKMHVYGDINVSNGTKNFRIQHPVLPEKDLVHCAIESPQPDLIYRGTGSLQNGSAEISIDESCNMSPGTFDALVRNHQVFLQNDDGWDRLKGYVSQGKVYVECENPESNDEFSWLVVGTRNDVTLEVEPEPIKMPG